MEKKKYTIKLMIKEVNVVNNIQIYWATNICNGFVYPQDDGEDNDMQEDTTEVKIMSV